MANGNGNGRVKQSSPEFQARLKKEQAATGKRAQEQMGKIGAGIAKITQTKYKPAEAKPLKKTNGEPMREGGMTGAAAAKRKRQTERMERGEAPGD